MSTRQLRVLSQPEYRVEGADKVSGRAVFAADVRREGMLDVSYVRSPYPHARILSVDASAARSMPGVHDVVTGDDIRPLRLGRRLQDWPLLAWDRVRLVGDRVAAVAAETRAQAEAAVDAIVVEYEELPAVLDPWEALSPGAPVLHPDAAEYHYLGGERPEVDHPNIQGRARHEHGDVAAGFAAAAHVFEHDFELARVYHGHLEPHVSVVWVEDDAYHVVCTNKSPFRLREQLATSLGIEPHRIIVDTAHIGGDFGGKGFSLDEYLLILLAGRTGRPVRYVTRSHDDIRAGNCRHAAWIRMRTGVDADHRIVAHETRILYDGGAYAAAKGNAALVPGGGLFTLIGYHVPNARVEATSVYTNTVPGGHARAPGQPQNSFAAESHLDLIARELGVDPLELRIRNAIRSGGVDALGRRWEESAMVEVLETLRRESRGGDPTPPGRGRGVALGARGSPSGRGGKDLAATLTMTLDADGQLEVLTAVTDQGAGAHTVIQRVIAEELGIDASRIRVRRGNTSEVPFDLGVGGSRVTPVVGGAARAAAVAVRRRLDEVAPGLGIDRQLEHAARTGGVREVVEFTHAPGQFSTYAYCVEVEVDAETGTVRLVDALFVADVGTVINPLALHGQLQGGFAFGLGQALMEELRVEEGAVSATLADYKLPTAADVPPLRIVLLTDHPGDGPFGAKSAGELANVSLAPAIANAIHDAVGVRVTSLPITAEKVFLELADPTP